MCIPHYLLTSIYMYVPYVRAPMSANIRIFQAPTLRTIESSCTRRAAEEAAAMAAVAEDAAGNIQNKT